MKTLKTESDVQKAVLSKLKVYEMTNKICWFSRLNSGAQQSTRGGWIKACDPGTPDIVIFTGKVLLFLECKKPMKRPLKFDDFRYEQKKFYKEYNDDKHIFVRLINDPEQLSNIIYKIDQTVS